MKLSIIVSVYNLEFYVADCLASLLNIPMSADEYEIIVIDDGSSDRSLDIIKGFSQKHEHVRFYSQLNKGVGAARNLGVEKATGTYIWFVDGDDFVNSSLVSKCLEEALTSKVDVLAFDFIPVNEYGVPEEWISFRLNFTGKQLVSGSRFYLDNYAKSYIWLYFFRRSLFTENDLRFHDYIKMQDGEIMPRIFIHCSNVRFSDNKLICYRQRENSAVNDKNEDARYIFYYSMVIVADRLRAFQRSINKGDLMFKALDLKRKQMNQMLFTNLIANRYSPQTNATMISLLREYRLLPFQKITGFTVKMNFVYNLIRKIVNLSPSRGRLVFQKMFLK